MKKDSAAFAIAIIALVSLTGGIVIAQFQDWVILFTAVAGIGMLACLAAALKNRSLFHVVWRAERSYSMYPLASVLLQGATILIAAYTAWRRGIGILPLYTIYIGFGLMAAGFMLLLQSWIAIPPHAKEKFDIQPVQAEEGPYSIIRCPVEMAGIMISIGLPLALASSLGFVTAVISAALLIVYSKMEDDYRFNAYAWFYDYTKRVPYHLLPFIW